MLSPDFYLAKVIGESDEGLTLFIPKAREGKFLVNKGDRFLTVVFLKRTDDGGVRPFVPWRT